MNLDQVFRRCLLRQFLSRAGFNRLKHPGKLSILINTEWLIDILSGHFGGGMRNTKAADISLLKIRIL